MHTTAGYLLGAALTGKYVFDIHDEDNFFCAGDVGWITGHTYVVYAPLMLGVATVVYEGTPAYPDFSRYWEIVAKHKVSQFYVAPTALRLLKRAGDHHLKHEMKHLRVLGSVGEPIAAEVWNWYFKTVGKEQAHVVDVSIFYHMVFKMEDTDNFADLLADRDWLTRDHTSRRSNTDEARKCIAPILRHRACDH